MKHTKSWAFSSRGKSPSLDIHTALTGGAHRIRLLSSRGKSRLPLAWHSRMRRALDQSALPPRVLEGV
ncbi:zinc finger protein [Trichonephila clavipes]|nr:zinc finger protein [Trichonephila clavipes]